MGIVWVMVMVMVMERLSASLSLWPARRTRCGGNAHGNNSKVGAVPHALTERSEHGKLRARGRQMVLNPFRKHTHGAGLTQTANALFPPENNKPQCLGSGYELLSRHTRRSIDHRSLHPSFEGRGRLSLNLGPLIAVSRGPRVTGGPEPRAASKRLHRLDRAALPRANPYPCACRLVVCGGDADGVSSNDGTKNPAAYPETARA